MPEELFDLRTLMAVVGTFIGCAGFLFGLLSHRWTRRESRLESLGKVLAPFLKSAQAINLAINCRRTTELLKQSFPRDQVSPEAVAAVNHHVKQYHEHMEESAKSFREAEVEFGTRHFRFPDGISKSIKETQTSLSALGTSVNQGLLDKAELQLAEFKDNYARITKIARGWRLADPFEWMKKRKNVDKEEVESEFELTTKEMDEVVDLLNIRATVQAENTFAVHPPRILLESPDLKSSGDVVEKLKDSIFMIVFQDGTRKMVSLPQLMAFMFNLIMMMRQQREVMAFVNAVNPQEPREFNIHVRFLMEQIMQPETVKILLSKIEFSKVASD